jgi:hypothetical protein
MLSGACYAVTSRLYISNTDTLNLFCLLSLLNEAGIIFWGYSSDSKKVFLLQKKVVRLMMGVKSHNSYTGLFKRIEILTLPCEYIFSLINFITSKEEHFQTNADIHSVNTRHKNYLHKPPANLSCFQKSTYYAGIKIFNNLPSALKILMHEKARFKIALKLYLNTHILLC